MTNTNTGTRNTGHYNTGTRNTGHHNTGHHNTGHYNTGTRNTGNRNTGHHNTGHHNTGHYNTGNRNTGHYNTRDYNTGRYNTGDYNTGDCNTGRHNTGYRNTGDYNTGDYNTGNYNTGNCNTGFFMTTTPEMAPAFNGGLVNRRDFLSARPDWMVWLPTTQWVASDDMTDAEKQNHPTHETTGGYLRGLSMHEAFAEAWEKNGDKDVTKIEALPGFDRDVWIEITGLDLWAKQIPQTIEVDGRTYRLETEA